MIPAAPSQDLREGGQMILRGWIPIHFPGWAPGDLQRSHLAELWLFNGSLKAQVQASCAGFQYLQQRERKAPLDGNLSHVLWLPLAQGARALTSLQVPGAGWSQTSPRWLSRLQELWPQRRFCIDIQSVSKIADSPVFSFRFFPEETFLVPILVSVWMRRIPLVSLGVAMLHTFSKT